MAEKSISDEVFGELKWDDESGEWIGKVEFVPGHFVTVSFYLDDDPIDIALEKAASTFAVLKNDEEGYRLATADKLLDLHNESWNRGSRIDRKTFAGRIRLESICFYPDDYGTELSYNDGDLFWGHSIIVEVNDEGVIEDADIAG